MDGYDVDGYKVMYMNMMNGHGMLASEQRQGE